MAFDSVMWMFYFLYIQAGILVGVGIERKIMAIRSDESQLKHGTKGRFVSGLGLSFGLQLYGVSYILVWTCGVVVSTVWSIYPVVFVYIQRKLEEGNELRMKVEGIERIIEESLGIKIDLPKDEIKGKDAKEQTEIIIEKIEKVKNGNNHKCQIPKKDAIAILSKMTP